MDAVALQLTCTMHACASRAESALAMRSAAPRRLTLVAAWQDLRISVPQLGEVRVDVAFGGMHYVVVDAADVGLELTPENGREIARIGEMIKARRNCDELVCFSDLQAGTRLEGPDIGLSARLPKSATLAFGMHKLYLWLNRWLTC
eukprot:6177048-Pleurochrysis_carterae.AAC.5